MNRRIDETDINLYWKDGDECNSTICENKQIIQNIRKKSKLALSLLSVPKKKTNRIKILIQAEC